MPSPSSSQGRHGGGHKDRQRGADGGKSRKDAERAKQARIAQSRGQADTSGRKRGGRSGK